MLIALSKSARGLSVYSLFQRSGVGFSVFSNVLSSLLSEQLIKEKREDFYTITPKGFTFILMENSQLDRQEWKNVPENFLCSKLDSKFYVPSKRLFKRKAF
ncbi:hypothetical protein VQ7734_02110 [Vibrio quintilis]|uniref:Uncharacterized protein n=2 Tax=Vibrio quintilis TaxID=1117707 RepID=A0A1M7YUV5_9VIBR|nr:hypothetical protein VQ7734_02110 [Vibrio quintilis]